VRRRERDRTSIARASIAFEFQSSRRRSTMDAIEVRSRSRGRDARATRRRRERRARRAREGRDFTGVTGMMGSVMIVAGESINRDRSR
jgi:hypothetical protein